MMELAGCKLGIALPSRVAARAWLRQRSDQPETHDDHTGQTQLHCGRDLFSRGTSREPQTFVADLS
jgi:hypothetical protein